MSHDSSANPGWKSVKTKEDVDIQFYTVARDALRAANVDALQHLQMNPGVSSIELTKRLARGASEIGLSMVLYTEAKRKGQVKQLAQELLYRNINAAFPCGWEDDAKVHASVKLGDWSYQIFRNVREFSVCAVAIIRDLTSKDSPPVGWIPSGADDPRLNALFNAHWKAQI